MKHHLSEEQFADLLSGEAPEPLAQQHLRSCEMCRTELEETRAAMQTLGQLSFAWAQAEAPRRVRTPSRLSLHLGGRPGWGVSMATLTAAAVIACTLLPAPHPVTSPAAAEEQQPAPPTNTDLAQDNRLLRSIGAELSYQTTSGIGDAGGSDTSSHVHRAAKATVND